MAPPLESADFKEVLAPNVQVNIYGNFNQDSSISEEDLNDDDSSDLSFVDDKQDQIISKTKYKLVTSPPRRNPKTNFRNLA